jgi:ribonucleoside-diphosphate reductase alpha chain
MNVIKRDGSSEPVDKRKIHRSVERACHGLDGVDVDLLVNEAHRQLYDNVQTTKIDAATVLAARSRVITEPNYSYVAARLVLNSLYRDVFGRPVDHRRLGKDYREAFVANLKALVDAGRFDPRLLASFDLDVMADALEPERDLLLKFLSVETLADRYLNHLDGRCMEAPQTFWMRVAMGLSLNEQDPTAFALKLYEQFSTLKSSPATPTLQNSGKVHAQLSSCFVATAEDSIDGIFGTLHSLSRLSKHGGGLGMDITPWRGIGATIKKTNGVGGGVIPWAKQYDSMVVGVNQGGTRPGACCLYMEVWHIDFPDFLDLRKGTGDDRRRAHNTDTASWICDEFMRRVEADQPWTLLCPGECPDLHDLYGDAFTSRYKFYEEEAAQGRLRNFRVVQARDLWKKMLAAIKETGHPWFTFKDSSNERYSNKHVGVIHSSQLCTEIFLHTKPTAWNDGEVVERGEVAVCTLHSINLATHADNQGKLNLDSLAASIANTIRALDNAVDLNFYPIPEAKKANMAHRPLGLGIMGWADLLQLRGLAFDSEEALELTDRVQEFVAYHSILASSRLAQERGKYATYEGSMWSHGTLPQDTYREFMQKHRGVDVGLGETLDWSVVRQHIKDHGMRNSVVMATAPTSTISSFLGCSEGIGPWSSVLYVYTTRSGDFTMFNSQFARDIKERGLWTPEFLRQLQGVDGDVLQMDLPTDIKQTYKKAFHIDQLKLIEGAARRQRWIDQGQSLNLYYNGKSMKELSSFYFHAWKLGLNSTYYLHGQAATGVAKFTIVDNAEREEADNPASETSPEGPALSCSMETGCESCQ